MGFNRYFHDEIVFGGGYRMYHAWYDSSFKLRASPVNAVLIMSRYIRLAAVDTLEGIDRLCYSVRAD